MEQKAIRKYKRVNYIYSAELNKCSRQRKTLIRFISSERDGLFYGRKGSGGGGGGDGDEGKSANGGGGNTSNILGDKIMID